MRNFKTTIGKTPIRNQKLGICSRGHNLSIALWASNVRNSFIAAITARIPVYLSASSQTTRFQIHIVPVNLEGKRQAELIYSVK